MIDRKKYKKRTVQLELTDYECDVIAGKCGMYGINVQEMLENLIHDLVGDERSGGSDEEYMADEYFDRRYAMYEPDNMLNYFLSWGEDIEDYMKAYDEEQYYKAHPEEYFCEIESLSEGELTWFAEKQIYYRDGYLREYKKDPNDVDFEKETEIIREYLKNYEMIMNTDDENEEDGE